MTGKPVFAASEREKVLFPDPAIPVTRMRRPIPKDASLIGRDESAVARVAYGEGDADPLGSADPDPLASGDPESDGDADGDALSEAEGTGMDGTGRGVGSGTKRDGISRKLRTKIATKITRTAMSHGRARRSLRVGREPR